MTWTESQKTNMLSLLDALAVQGEALLKKKRLAAMEKREAGPRRTRQPKSAEMYLSAFYDKFQMAGERECWNWKLVSNPNGYGQIRICDVLNYAHRVSFFLEHGRFPLNDTRHECDNRRCVNPSHLLEGTRKENMMDCKLRGRFVKSRGSAKLFPEQVQGIRSAYSSGGQTFRSLAAQFGITHQNVNDIVNRKIWKNIP